MNKSNNSHKPSKTFIFLSLLTILVVSLLLINRVSKREMQYRKDVLSSYRTTIGEYLSSSNGGDIGHPYITYQYKVDNQTYKRELDGSSFPKIRFCINRDNSCSSYRFWVIYSIDEPDKSLIDLTNYTVDSTSVFPPDLDSFR